MIAKTFDAYTIISLHDEGFFHLRGWNFLSSALG